MMNKLHNIMTVEELLEEVEPSISSRILVEIQQLQQEVTTLGQCNDGLEEQAEKRIREMERLNNRIEDLEQMVDDLVAEATELKAHIKLMESTHDGII